MRIDTGVTVAYCTEEDASAQDLHKPIVIDSHVSSAEIFDAISASRGRFDHETLQYWKNNEFYSIKVINEFGCTLDHAGFVMGHANPRIQIFPKYKNIISENKIMERIKV